MNIANSLSTIQQSPSFFPADEIDTALEVLYCERKPIEEELRRIKSVIRKNSSFEKYITSSSILRNKVM